MQQLVIKKGTVSVISVPAPAVEAGYVLVQTAFSLVSTGTESTIVKSSGESLVSKAKDPNLLRMGIDAVKRNGVKKTLEMIRGIQDSETAFGYSLSGTVVAVGAGVTEFAIGDKVACAGAGKANHAEFVAVPKNLVVKIPKGVSLEEAASTTLGSIAMQGVRQADPKLGEVVAVVGTGLLGLLAVQMLAANGCIVLVSDTDPSRLKLAKEFGAAYAVTPGELQKLVSNLTGTHGVDATLIYAATSSDAPLNQAMQITRKRGTVVVIGAVGMKLSRSPFYEKEINFKISCSYGPGRYDADYEEKGHDYPYGFVRWTENRNMQAYLNLIAAGKLRFQPMVEKIASLDEAPAVYQQLVDPEVKKKPLAVLIKYPDQAEPLKRLSIEAPKKAITKGPIKVGFIGAGGFVSQIHLPNFKQLGNDFTIHAICNRTSVQTKNLATQYGAQYISTDPQELLKDKEIDLIVIGTRHNSHAKLTVDALNAGKSVFVEKPLALTEAELEEVTAAAKKSKGHLFVGFNRRFSPHSVAIKKALTGRIQPLMAYYRMNAGFLPPSHWTQTDEGGGRILGEACHILDLFGYWTGSEPTGISVNAIQPKGSEVLASDNSVTTVTYADGSVCTLVYTAQGNAGLEKEYAELFFDRNSIVLHDYRETTGYGVRLAEKTLTNDKGHLEQMRQIAKAMRNEDNTWDLDQIITASHLSLAVDSQLKG
jgi:predicted dehydrogenase